MKYLILLISILACSQNPTRPIVVKGDPNMDTIPYEVSDIVLVSRRIQEGYSVWAGNGTADDKWQEWSADLNCDNVVDMKDINLFLEKLEG